MRPHSDAEAPSIEYGVLQRLKRLDRDLLVTWSKYSIDPLNGAVLEHRGRPVIDPAYHLWVRHGAGADYAHCALYPHGQGFGHREVAKLERDCARTMAPGDIMRTASEAMRSRRARDKATFEDTQRAKIRANKSRIRDLVFEGKSGQRDAKLYSGGGMAGRGTPGQIQTDARDDGWELPEN